VILWRRVVLKRRFFLFVRPHPILYPLLPFLLKMLLRDKMTDEIDYCWCWMQLRHRADAETNKMMDIIENAYIEG